MLRNRNLMILFGCQLISISGSVVMVTVAGLVGNDLAANPALATLPMSLVVVGTALAAAPAAMLMSRTGRRPGFMLGASLGVLSMLVAVWSVSAASFVGFMLATLLFGLNLAFVQQYRFAAAESVPPEDGPRAISLVLFAPIGGAILGPEMILYGGRIIPGVPYAGTFAALAVLYLLAFGLLAMMQSTSVPDPIRVEAPDATTVGVLRRPVFWVAVACGVIAYGVMALIMTATPLSMRVFDNFDLRDTTNVIRSHVIAMYLPSLIFSWLMVRLGLQRLLLAGVIVFGLVVTIAAADHTWLHYWGALVLLGIGWNWLYLGGTTLLTRLYRSEERFTAQAINEFSVFAMSAAASLLAGYLLQLSGWRFMVLSVVPLLVALGIVLVGFYGRIRVAALRPVT
jgi:MFS family permease